MPNILIIEDNRDLRLTLTWMLQDEGYNVLNAPDGEKGMELSQETPIDVVITDIFIPEKDGLEIIRDLKETFPLTKIIAISGGGGSGHTEYLEVARMFGAQKVFEKPVDINDLLDAIKELLDAR
jgi:DNA-binding response OmpR family regulator